MREFITAIIVSLFVLPATIKAQNIYPAAGDVSIVGYSPLLILQRNTADGGFIQGIQTRLNDGTNSWYFGALHKDKWIVSKGDYSNPKLIVTGAGNVGIGEQLDPTCKLFVEGGDIGFFQPNNATSGIVWKNSYYTKVSAAIKPIDMGAYATQGIGFFTGNFEDNMTAPLERMRITRDGNVGIGTTNTGSFKLAVEGKIGAREVVVLAPGTAWPDYVFAPEYKLRTLEEIEQFVKEKQHLPDVPSAEVVAKDGVNLGEMNAILLKKLEEQTLYILELNRQIQDIKLQLTQMKK